MSVVLNERLKKAASLVGTFSGFAENESCVLSEAPIVACDVGCDHAYLSLHLVLSGRCDRVIASDLRQGPLASAQANIRAHGCENQIHTVLTDGLDGLEGLGITDAVICGMGGDTMIDILSRASFLKKRGTRLILQPQSAFAELALYLAGEGFHIVTERYALEHRKPYRIIGAVFCGSEQILSHKEALVGSPSFEEDREAYTAFCNKILNTIEKKIGGAKRTQSDTSYLDALYRDIVLSMNV